MWAGYLERGNISTTDASVLLVHGFSGSSSDFLGLLKKLPENYHVVAVDLLNHGGSSSITDREVLVDDMVHFIKKVNLFPYCLILEPPVLIHFIKVSNENNCLFIFHLLEKQHS